MTNVPSSASAEVEGVHVMTRFPRAASRTFDPPEHRDPKADLGSTAGEVGASRRHPALDRGNPRNITNRTSSLDSSISAWWHDMSQPMPVPVPLLIHGLPRPIACRLQSTLGYHLRMDDTPQELDALFLQQ